jgi:hypothetical protein
MPNKIRSEIWENYMTLLQKKKISDQPPFPASLQYEGKIDASIDFVPSEIFLMSIRQWLMKSNIGSVYYFITEGAPEDFSDYELTASELSYGVLQELNNRCSNLIVSKNFDWAIFIDREGTIHVAGSKSLMNALRGAYKKEPTS